MSWTGQLSLAAGRALYVGPADDTTAHAHWAIQVAVGLEGPVRLDAAGARNRHEGVVIASNVAHALGAANALALVYLEPLSDLGRVASAFLCERPLATLPHATVRAIRERAARLDDIAAELGRRLGAPPVAGASDRMRARRIEIAIERGLDGRVRLGDVAAELRLSPSRVAAIVRRATGMSLRPLVRWCRLRVAIAAVGRGATLTEAAHAAGFADSAHFTRTMRSAFGVAPSAGLRSLMPPGRARPSVRGRRVDSRPGPRSRDRRS